MHKKKTVVPGVTLLYGVKDECCMYLVEGKTKALLIDTGFGTTDIRVEAEGMTGLPVIAVNTHGHGDHSGGDMYFDEMYMSAGAEADARESLALNKTVLPADAVKAIEHRLAEGSFKAKHVSDGFLFDLGGKCLEVIDIPGHTAGCIALLDKEDRLLFSGDCLLKAMDILLVVPQALSLSQYVSSMKKLQARESEFDYLCTGHDMEKMPSRFIDESIGCCERIISGEAVGEELTLPPVFGDTHARRVACGDFAVAYRPGKL